MPSRRCRRCRRPDRACHRPSTRCSGIQWPRRTVRRCRCRRCWCPRCTPSAPQVWLAVAWSQVPWCKPSSGTAAPAWPFGRHAVVARSQYVPCAQSSPTQHPSPGTQVPCPSFCALQYPESHVPPQPRRRRTSGAGRGQERRADAAARRHRGRLRVSGRSRPPRRSPRAPSRGREEPRAEHPKSQQCAWLSTLNWLPNRPKYRVAH